MQHSRVRVKVLDGKKLCSKCKELLPIDNFSKDMKQASGLRFRCKKCDELVKQNWIDYPPDYTKEKICRVCGLKKHGTCFSVHKRSLDGLQTYCKDCKYNRQLMDSFGITLADYDKMFEEQDGNCAICGLPEINRRLSVDHCHATDKIRGLLCMRCNTAMGLVDDDIDKLLNMVRYLQ